MSEQNPAVFLQAGSHPAEDVRRMFTALTGWNGYGGIVSADSLEVTEKSGTPDMSVDVATGAVWIPGDEATYQGLYFCENRGTTNVAISAADATNARKDLVVAKVEDSGYSGATDAWSIAVVTGTPAASPVEPNAPSNALVLALVDVPALDTSIEDAQITDRRTSSGLGQAQRGIRKTLSSAHPSTVDPGDVIFETDNERFLVYDGGASDFVEFSSYREATGTASYGGGTTYVQACTLTLPRGIWFVVASGYFEWSTGAASYVNTLKLEQDNTTSIDTSEHLLPATSGRAPVSVQGIITVSASSSTVDLDAKTDTASGVQLLSSGKMTAISVSG